MPQPDSHSDHPFFQLPPEDGASHAAVVPAADASLTQRQVAGPTPAPGWYPEPDNPGVVRYWNGVRWEDWRKPIVEAPTVGQGQKEMAPAYLLALFLGGFGAHNFYLGRTGVAVTQLVLTALGVLTAVLFVGFVLLIAVGIWVLVDLCLIPSYVRASSLSALSNPHRQH